jgi:membrane protein DedA with SNARE-associated domain
MAIDAVFPAFSELVMLYGGALASGALTRSLNVFGTDTTGFKAYVAIVAAGTIGYLLGALVGWGIGLHGGRRLLERHGRWLHLGPERVGRAERWFQRWGDLAVLIGRVTPVVRSFVSIPAGVFRVPFARYTVLTAIGSLVWCLVLGGIGWGLGASWSKFDHGFHYVEYALVAAILAGAAVRVIRWRRSTTMA